MIRRTARRSVWATLAVAVLALLLGSGGVARALPDHAGAKPKPRVCRSVVKVVRGHRRRVRVCRPKPAAKAPAKPRNVSLALDSEGAASAAIGSAGGTVVATSKAGAKMTLAVPSGALDADVEVRATPVTALGGVPGGVRVLGAVQLAPEGLVLAKPATLTIDLPSAPRTTAGFAWFGAGANVHRYPIARSGSSMTLRITHFSGAGVASGPTGWLATAVTALSLYYPREVRPLMRAAETDDTQLTHALDVAFGWERHVELAGLSERFATWKAEIRAWVPRAVANAVAKASAKCTGHDLTQLGRLLALEKLVQTMALSVAGPSAFERYVQCARFELEVEYSQSGSVHDATASEEHSIESDLTAKATVPIAMTERLEGEAPVVPSSWHYLETLVSRQADPPFSCTSTAIAAAPAENVRVMLAIDPAGAVTLLVTPGAVRLTRSNCFDASSRVVSTTDVPIAFAGDTPFAGTAMYSVSFASPAARVLGGDVYATYGPETVSGTVSGMSYTLSRSFVLRHVPQR